MVVGSAAWVLMERKVPVTLLVSIAPALVAGEHVGAVPPSLQPLPRPLQGQRKVTAPVLCFSPCAGAVSALPVAAQGLCGVAAAPLRHCRQLGAVSLGTAGAGSPR